MATDTQVYNDMQVYYAAATAVEYCALLGGLIDEEGPVTEDNTLDAYAFHDGWGDLMLDLASAGAVLGDAVRAALDKGVDVDSYLTGEKFAQALLDKARELTHWPASSDLPELAERSITV